MIHVIATIELAEGKRDAFLSEFRKIVPAVRGELGCLEYGPAVDMPTGIASQAPLRENVVTIVEKWASLEALKLHMAAPHMAEYRSRVKDMVTSISLNIMQPA